MTAPPDQPINELPGSALREDAIEFGKTSTTFKAATLLKENEHVHKCVFVVNRMIFDGERLSDLFVPRDLGWKASTQAELALTADLHPLLTK